MRRKIRMGMVGGGQGAFIGAVHRMAANLDGKIELVAGCFSSNPENSKQTGEQLYINPDRVYSSYQEMAEAEAKLPADVRIDFVSIVTPNFMHFPVAATFLKLGFHVVCDKPMTLDLEEAEALEKIVAESGKIFALTHNYTGYPMIKEARELVKSGKLGKIFKTVAEYSQGWLITQIEQNDQKQAAWRVDSNKAGKSCCLGDIGTHAENIVHYITGLEIESICAEFTTFIEGRSLEDDSNLLIRYRGGAKGLLFSSQISAGEENNLVVRIYGEKGSLEWHQEDPNDLIIKFQDAPRQVLRRGNSYLGQAAQKFTRLPAGHPEAFIEAFANIYLEVAEAVLAYEQGAFNQDDYDFPTVKDGVAGMRFLNTAVRSAEAGAVWESML